MSARAGEPEVGDGTPSEEQRDSGAKKAAEGQPLWHGRFREGPSEDLLAFTVSLPYDRRLAAEDLAGSRAHVAMLTRVGLLTEEEHSLVAAALTQVGEELDSGEFAFAPTDEDIHTAIERRVTELAGPPGSKLHTGRSRNDQVSLDLRLYLRREGREQIARLVALQEVLVRRAEEAGDAYLPGYTHLQRAQPVTLAHHLLAHFWALTRDVDRWRDALARADVSPLGAGALAGSSLPLDPESVRVDLRFARLFENSLDAVSDRDFVAEVLFVTALVQVHVSRIGEEIALWSSDEFGFVQLADAYATGSSMMPQKKNPDIAELARGKAGRLIGNLAGFLATLKGLPLAYNRDLQEDKEPLFDALDTCRLTLSAMTGMLDTIDFVYGRMAEAADSATTAATDLAEHLVLQGTPFREAHAIVGALVRQAVERGVPLDELVSNDPRLGPAAVPLLAPGEAVRRRTSPGGGGPTPVARQLERASARLADERARLE